MLKLLGEIGGVSVSLCIGEFSVNEFMNHTLERSPVIVMEDGRVFQWSGLRTSRDIREQWEGGMSPIKILNIDEMKIITSTDFSFINSINEDSDSLEKLLKNLVLH